MRTRLITIILTCSIALPACFTDTACAEEGSGARLLFAQADTGAASSRRRAPLPPLPPAKNAIATEKDIPGIPGEPKPSPAQSEPEPAPPVTDAQPAQQQQPADQTETPPAAVDQTAAETTPGTPVPAAPVPAITTPSVTGAASALAGAAAAAAALIPADADSTAQLEQIPVQQQPQPVPSPVAATPEVLSTLYSEELSLFNVSTANLRTMKLVIDDEYNLRGMVYGEEQGYIRILEANNDGEFDEVWKSPLLNSPVRGLFVVDLEGDGDAEIVAYTADGTLLIYDYKSRDQVYRTPEGMYAAITCMIVENLDSDPQKEIFFLASRSGGSSQGGEIAGNLIQFDTVNLFEEWTSSEVYTATDMVFGNVDSDDEPEIVLNTGEILSLRFKNAEWKSSTAFGSRMYLIDLDDDGILELVSEYDQSYVRVFDIDQRREKW